MINNIRVSFLIIFSAFSLSSTPNPFDFNKSDNASITVGADRLLPEFSHLIDDKNVALVANHSSRLTSGEHLADVLYAYSRAELVVLFGMSFNIRSNDYSLSRDKQADVDPKTGLPKYSLYGDIHKPTDKMLEGVDVLIFDIQEVGARFYEHVNVLGFVMEAAAEQDIEVIVLDRPNPITGRKMDGFLTDDEFLYGFGAFGKIPIIHGMTIGELALLYNGEGMLRNGQKAELHVINMKIWNRSMWYDETGMQWRKPSPNLPTIRSILAYVGTCIFEALNISEGRGTEKPFEYIGAPWINHAAAAEMLNNLGLGGATFEPITFVPERKPFHGGDPYLSGERCNGIYVKVTNRDLFEPYKAGNAMVWAIHNLHPEQMKWEEEVANRLTGTRRLIRMIENGATPDEIFDSWKAGVADFKKMSKQYWLY